LVLEDRLIFSILSPAISSTLHTLGLGLRGGFAAAKGVFASTPPELVGGASLGLMRGLGGGYSGVTETK